MDLCHAISNNTSSLSSMTCISALVRHVVIPNVCIDTLLNVTPTFGWWYGSHFHTRSIVYKSVYSWQALPSISLSGRCWMAWWSQCYQSWLVHVSKFFSSCHWHPHHAQVYYVPYVPTHLSSLGVTHYNNSSNAPWVNNPSWQRVSRPMWQRLWWTKPIFRYCWCWQANMGNFLWISNCSMSWKLRHKLANKCLSGQCLVKWHPSASD